MHLGGRQAVLPSLAALLFFFHSGSAQADVTCELKLRNRGLVPYPNQVVCKGADGTTEEGWAGGAGTVNDQAVPPTITFSGNQLKIYSGPGRDAGYTDDQSGDPSLVATVSAPAHSATAASAPGCKALKIDMGRDAIAHASQCVQSVPADVSVWAFPSGCDSPDPSKTKWVLCPVLGSESAPSIQTCQSRAPIPHLDIKVTQGNAAVRPNDSAPDPAASGVSLAYDSQRTAIANITSQGCPALLCLSVTRGSMQGVEIAGDLGQAVCKAIPRMVAAGASCPLMATCLADKDVRFSAVPATPAGGAGSGGDGTTGSTAGSAAGNP